MSKQEEQPVHMQTEGFVRDSKYQNLFGVLANKTGIFENVHCGICKAENVLKCTSKFFAVPWKSVSGAAILVRRLDQTGRVFDIPPVVTGHKNLLTDLEFSPFFDNFLASSAMDNTVS